MKNLSAREIWYVTGSQHLYGEAALRQVAANAQKIVAELNEGGALPFPLVFKPILTRPEEIRALILEANASSTCAGLILWMHTFSPSKMWIGGLLALAKPFLHLHTQYGRDLPWADIDMDFMNLHQSAHGDREAGFIHTRRRRPGRSVNVFAGAGAPKTGEPPSIASERWRSSSGRSTECEATSRAVTWRTEGLMGSW